MKKKKKLVLLSAFYEPFMSGAEQMTKNIAERLNDKYEIIILTGRYDKTLAKEEQKDGFVIKRLGIANKKLDKFLYIILATLEVRKLKPEIVHAIMESYAGGALFLVKYLFSLAKRILTLQSGDLDSDVKQKNFYIRFFWKIIHLSPNYITAISSFLAQRAKNLGVDDERIFITPNGIDISKVPQNILKEKNRVVMVGRLSWEKGHKYLLEAWSCVIKIFPDAKLFLIGEGGERKNIEEIIKNLKISDSVILTGNLPHQQVLEEICKSEIFVCPSLAEGLGNVFIEAQACGTTPIGTRVGGIPDIIKNEKNGLLIKPKNVDDIKNAIIKLLTDKELNKKLSLTAQEDVKKFQWENIIKDIEYIYEL